MLKSLEEFLAESRSLPFDYAGADCCSWAAMWVERVHGRTVPVAAVQTRDGADRLLSARGSLAEVCGDAMSAYGLPVVEGWPQAGDVGVVLTPRGQACGIFGKFGDWHWKARIGYQTLKPVPRRIVRAWRVCCDGGAD